VARFPRMSRGPKRKKSESLHTEQRGKENMASPKRDDGKIPTQQENQRELKRTRQVSHQRRSAAEIRSLSLTGIPDLRNNVEVVGGRLTQPRLLHGLPWFQLFGALTTLRFEVATKMFITTFEINVDLLERGSKPCHFTSRQIATHRWCSPSTVPTYEDQYPSEYSFLASLVSLPSTR
jgi:hypothetical protein